MVWIITLLIQILWMAASSVFVRLYGYRGVRQGSRVLQSFVI